MKWLVTVLGVLIAATGVVWILQGTDVLKTGFMAGQMQWAYIGIVALIVGIVLLLSAAVAAGSWGDYQAAQGEAWKECEDECRLR